MNAWAENENQFLNAAVTICSNFELKMDIKYCIADDLDGKSTSGLLQLFSSMLIFLCSIIPA